MVSLWNIYPLLLLSLPPSLLVVASTGENVGETPQPEIDGAARLLTQPSRRSRGPGSVRADNPIAQTEGDDLRLPFSWLLSAPEEMDRQGVIGEYSDLQERADEGATEDPVFEGSVQTKMSSSQPTVGQTHSGSAGINTATSVVSPPQTREALTTPQTGITGSQRPFLPASPPPPPPRQDSVSVESAGRVPHPQRPARPTDSSGLTTGIPVSTQAKADGVTDVTGRVSHQGTVHTPAGEDVPKESSTVMTHGNTDASITSCKTPNQSWTSTYPDDSAPSESLHPSAALSPALLVPLYSDWNSALATWGFAWEAHVYGLGSVFTAFCLISVVCLLGLPLRCPPGSLHFTVLYLFILAFAGMQAFGLLYDAYSHLDRLPPLVSLLLSELPFPCLTAAFSLAFLLLSMRSRMHISLPLALSAPFSALPKPCILLSVSILQFIVSLGCVGLLQLFHTLPAVILLCPRCLFVCLAVFLSCSYLIFYCLTQVNTKHIYRLNDNGESGDFSEVMQPPLCPFAKVEDWERAAGAGVGTSLCLLGCGGCQLYGILHALGLGGVEGYGFQPWPWWGYQVGCRLCEVGVCLGLSLIATHPLFCHSNASIKSLTQPRPGSWSRLSCSSPLRGPPLPAQGGSHSPVAPSHDSWSQGKQEKLVVCDVVTNRQSEALPLCSMVDPPRAGADGPQKPIPAKTLLPLPTPPCPPLKAKNAAESQLSSLDSLGLESDSTVDLRPPSPIDLSRSIDQALFSESLFTHSIFGLPRVFPASSSLSLNSPGQSTSKQGPSSGADVLYRTSSCGDVDQDNAAPTPRPSQPHGRVAPHGNPPAAPEQWDWKESITGSTQGLCSQPKETGKSRSNSWANRGQNFAQSSLPRGIPHLSYHRRYRTLSLASQDSQGSGRLAGTKQLSESKQLEWDLAVQAEFVNVCRQIDALSVCSDTIEL